MLQKGIGTPLADFQNIEELEAAINGTMWDKETDLALFNLVKGKAFGTINVTTAEEAAEPFIGRLIEHASNPGPETAETDDTAKKKAANGRKSANGGRKKQAAPSAEQPPAANERETIVDVTPTVDSTDGTEPTE